MTRRISFYDRGVAGFRYALVLENGEPADPAVFATRPDLARRLPGG